MPTPKATVVKLSETEQKGLEQLIGRHKVEQQIALRGRIILAAGRSRPAAPHPAAPRSPAADATATLQQAVMQDSHLHSL